MLACVDDPKLDDSTASHPSSWSHSLPHRVVCHPGHNAGNTMRRRLWAVSFYGFSAHASFTYILLVGTRQSVSVSATVTAVSEPSFSAVVSVTARTGLSATTETRKKTGYGPLLASTCHDDVTPCPPHSPTIQLVISE